MKEFAKFTIDKKDFRSAEELSALERIAEKTSPSRLLTFSLPLGSEVFHTVFSYLESLGKRPGSRFSARRPGDYFLVYVREYSTADIEDSPLLQGSPLKRADSAAADAPIPHVHTDQVTFSHGRLRGIKRLLSAAETGKPDIYAFSSRQMIATEGFRTVFNEGGLVGAQFVPITVEARGGN